MKTVIKIAIIILGLILLLFAGLLVIILTAPSPDRADTVAEINADEAAETDLYEATDIIEDSFGTHLNATLNGRPIDFQGPAPIVVDNYNSLFPLRAIFEALGFDVFWDGDTRINIVSGRDKIIVIPVDNNAFYIDNEGFDMPLSTRIIDGSTMISLTIFRHIGYDISWDAGTNMLAINSLDINNEDS